MNKYIVMSYKVGGESNVSFTLIDEGIDKKITFMAKGEKNYEENYFCFKCGYVHLYQ